MYRNTYAQINIKNIYENTKAIVEKYNNYKYHFGVVKADCYGHARHIVIEKILNAGINYLAVATLDEALEIRKYFKDVPILVLGVIPINYLEIAKKNDITITVNSYEYAKQINEVNLKVHIKINTGMNRLGINNKEEVEKTYKVLQNQEVEGIYTHIHTPKNKELTLKQFKEFEDITKTIDLNQIPIVHICASYAFENYEKLPYANGVRLGINMYGLSNVSNKNTFKLVSEIIQINNLKKRDTLGYDAKFVADEDTKIGVVPIGYADGIIRANSGRYVFIKDQKYEIVGNICMDMLFIKIDDNVSLGDEVVLIKDNDHLKYIANYLNTVPYEVICSIGKRVPRIFID